MLQNSLLSIDSYTSHRHINNIELITIRLLQGKRATGRLLFVLKVRLDGGRG